MPVHMNLLVAPIPLVGELAGAELALPQAQAHAAREAAFDALVRDRQKTPAVDPQTGLESLGKDGGGQGPPPRRQQRGRRRPASAEPAPTITHAHAEGPWQGVLINVNV